MSKRLQVLLDDEEMGEVRELAKASRLSVAEWVRQSLRQARQEQPLYDNRTKIQVVREAVRHRYPAGEIEDLLGEIARGTAGNSSS